MRTTLMILFTCTLGLANTLVNPTYGQAETNCNYTTTAPYTTSTCPVIGAEGDFNIASISLSVSGTTVTAVIDFDYAGTSSLAAYQDGTITLQPGDLFFYDPSDPTKLLYGVAVDSTRPNSNAFVAGDLYKISGAISTETASQALGNPSVYYRPTQTVLMTDTTGTPTVAGTGTEKVTKIGTGNEYQLTLTFTATSDLLKLINSSVGVEFSSADCGNAVLAGTISATPEPGATALMGIGIGMIGLAGYWRKRSARHQN